MRTYTAPDGTVWNLDQDAIDTLGGSWTWDGRAIDPAAGPDLHSVAQPLVILPLLGLARHCGLRQLPAASTEAHLLDPLDAALMRLAPSGHGAAAERQVA